MAAAGHTLRVNQLDALRVDEELLLLLQQEVGAALHHTFPAAAAKYRRELQLLLQLFFFCCYTLRNVPTPGAVLQNVRYGDSKTSNSNGSSSRINTIRHRSTSRHSLGSSTNGTGHRNCSSTGTARDSSISGADHVAEGSEQHLHRQQVQQSAGIRVSQQPLHAETQGKDRIRRSSSKSGSPAMQQNLSLRQRLLLLLLSTVLPYSFERVQQYIHRRYTALLAVLQQRMLRAQAVRRMQQHELRRRQQQQHLQSSVWDQQSTSQRHQQSLQQRPHQQLRERHPSPSQEPHQRQQHGMCCNKPESTMRGSVCSRCHHCGFDGSVNIESNSRDSSRQENRVDSFPQLDDSCVTPRGASAVQWGCNSSQTSCSCTAASASGSAALAVSLSAAAPTSAASEAPQPLAASPVLLSREEKRILLLYKASQIAELLMSMTQLLQTFCFLATGRYRCLSDWLLLLHMQHIDPSLHRSITLDLLQQQLGWQAVLQLLLMVLPQLPQQESLLRMLSARLRRIHMDMTARVARLRTSCIVFLQRQVRRHVPTQRQQEERPRLLLHQRHEHRREGDSTRVQKAVRTNSQQQQHGREQVEEGQPLEEEVQQPQQQHQRHRAQYSLEELTSPYEQPMQRHRRIRRRAVGRTKEKTVLMQHEQQKTVLYWGSSGDEPPQQMHACTQSIIQSVGNWLRHSAVRVQSRVIKHSCLQLLRILHPSTSHVPPVSVTSATRAAATPAAPAAPGTVAAVIGAADTPTADAAGGVPAALAQRAAAVAPPAAWGRNPCGNCHTVRSQSSSSEREDTVLATAARRNRGRASTAVTQLERQGNTTRLLQGQQQTQPSASPAQRCDTRKRHERSAGTGGSKELLQEEVQNTAEVPDEVPDEALKKEEALDELLASWRPPEFREQCVAALQHEQEQQEQQQEPPDEEGEDVGCVFCGRSCICLAFRGRNCSHRFCYYCVAAHPIYRERVKRQQAPAAAAAVARRRAAQNFGTRQSARPSLAAEGVRVSAAGPGEASPGATAEAPGAGEKRHLIRTATAGHREGERPRSSLSRREETNRDGSSRVNVSATSSSGAKDSGNSCCNREEKRRRCWLAFFGLTLAEEAEEDTLKCPSCGVLVEEIQWAA